MNRTIIAALIFLVLAAGAVLANSWIIGRTTQGARALNLVICLAGALTGMAFGILRFPLDENEKIVFGELEKGLGLIVTGYLGGKVDTLFSPMFRGETDTLFVSRVLLAVSSFLIAVIAEFYARWYVADFSS